MKLHNVIQSTQAWHDLRDKHFSASEAAAVMGDHKYMSRDDLLKQYATGVKPEITPQQQKLFDKGHASEAAARPIAEDIIGQELYPVTATDDDDWLLASMDGLTMLGDIGFEHKLYSAALAAQVEAKKLDPHYLWQLEHQAMVTGCEQILFMTSDGTEENCKHFMYTPDKERQKQLIAGWKQFERDLAEYKTKLANGEIKKTVQAQAEVLLDLPAITYKMNGLALTSDLEKFKEQARLLIKKSREPLVTDDDFATAESLVKVFKSAEDKLSVLSEQVIGEVSDIDAFIKELKQVSEGMRQARLATEKLVTAEKQNRRQEIINKAQHDFNNHIQAQMAKLDGNALPAYNADFAGAMKGKKTIESLQSAANDCLANAKIAISQRADEIQRNLKSFAELATDHKFLFADLQQLLWKEEGDFISAVKSRISDHKEAEEKRLEAERERIRQEEAEHDAAFKAQMDAEVQADIDEMMEGVCGQDVAAENKQLADEYISSTVNGMLSGRGPSPEKNVARPSNAELTQVIANHYGVKPIVAAGWLKEMAVAA